MKPEVVIPVAIAMIPGLLALGAVFARTARMERELDGLRKRVHELSNLLVRVDERVASLVEQLSGRRGGE